MPNTKRRPGRPKTPLLQRLEARLSRPFDPTNWPQTESPCWHDRLESLWYEPNRQHQFTLSSGKNVTLVRACLGVVLGIDVPTCWHLPRTCGDKACVNPHHRTIVPRYSVKHGVPIDIPEWLQIAMHPAQGAVALEISDDFDPAEVRDAIDMILHIDGRNTPVADLYHRFQKLYSIATLEAALCQIRTELL